MPRPPISKPGRKPAASPASRKLACPTVSAAANTAAHPAGARPAVKPALLPTAGQAAGPAAERPAERQAERKCRTAAPGADGLLPPSSYWRRLVPELHIADEDFIKAGQSIKLPQARVAQLRHQLMTEGFFCLHPEELPWSVSLGNMQIGVKRIVAKGWPATLLMMYDEVWSMANQLAWLMKEVSGCVNSLDTLAWMVTPSLGQSGFAPHRDRQPMDVPGSFRSDGR